MSSESSAPATAVPPAATQPATPAPVIQDTTAAAPDAVTPIIIKPESAPSETSILAPEKISMSSPAGLSSDAAETAPEPSPQPVSATSTAPNSPSKPKADALPTSSESLAAVAVPGQQYVVMLQSDPSGKLVGTLPPGFTAAGGAVVRPNITLKRGASKTMMATTAPSQSSISKPMMIAKPAAPTARPVLSGTSQAVKTVTVPSVVTSSGVIPGVTQVFLPAVSSTGPSVAAPSSASGPSPNAMGTSAVTVKPPVRATTVVKTKPSAATVAVANGATNAASASSVNGVARSVTVKTGVMSNGAGGGISTGIVKKVASKSAATIVPTKTGMKTTGGHTVTAKVLNKPLTSYDKALQQKRALLESVTKFRKVEKAMLVGRPDQSTPFTYAEIFHHAAVSFSRMASLTTHVSLESQTSMEQRRWTPELINKFVSSINTFATSLKEVGDELKKKHEQQIVANFKRKAETEMANAKKLALLNTTQDGSGPKTTPNVMNSFLSSVVSAATKTTDKETEEASKQPLSMATTLGHKPVEPVNETNTKPSPATTTVPPVPAEARAPSVGGAGIPTAEMQSGKAAPESTSHLSSEAATKDTVNVTAPSTNATSAAEAGANVPVDTSQAGDADAANLTGDPSVEGGSRSVEPAVPQTSPSTHTTPKEQDIEMPDASAMPIVPVSSP